LTLGHEQAILDCLQIFDEVVIAILINPQKQPCFTVEQRIEMIKLAFPNEKRITIVGN
jgi:pantetheine-phosphate adenylyltransferase